MHFEPFAELFAQPGCRLLSSEHKAVGMQFPPKETQSEHTPSQTVPAKPFKWSKCSVRFPLQIFRNAIQMVRLDAIQMVLADHQVRTLLCQTFHQAIHMIPMPFKWPRSFRAGIPEIPFEWSGPDAIQMVRCHSNGQDSGLGCHSNGLHDAIQMYLYCND